MAYAYAFAIRNCILQSKPIYGIGLVDNPKITIVHGITKQ